MQPIIFVSHGAPTLAIEDNPANRFLRELGRRLARPESILVVSAHWMTEIPTVSAAEHPTTIHDFGGFPAELYEMQYPAPGAPAVANRVSELLQTAGLDCDISANRGLDHGAWVPLMLMYPEATIPVTQVSIQFRGTTASHFNLGRALSALRHEDILILASGGAVHNLGALNPGSQPAEWATHFDDWLYDKLTNRKFDDIVNYRRLIADGRLAHPTEDHLLPLLVAMGAAEESNVSKVECLHRSWTYGSLSMASYSFE